MRFNIYCDEASTTAARYMLIGGLWTPWDDEPVVRAALAEVRTRHGLKAEMKWTKVSRRMLPAYQDFVDVFFNIGPLSFKCIVLDTHILDYKTVLSCKMTSQKPNLCYTRPYGRETNPNS